MDRILVGLDASPRATGILETAVELARRTGGKLILFRAVGVPHEIPVEAYSMTPANLAELLEREAKKYLDKLAETLPPGMLADKVVHVGTPWQGVCSAADQHKADMIVIGSHGRLGARQAPRHHRGQGGQSRHTVGAGGARAPRPLAPRRGVIARSGRPRGRRFPYPVRVSRLETNGYYALGVPLYVALGAVELALARRKGITAYRFGDTVGNLSAGLGEVIIGLFLGPWLLALYDFGFTHIALVRWPEGSWIPWVLAFLAGDLCYYWYHRAGHTVAAFWAIHGVHHQTEQFNLSIAIRHPWFSDFYSAPFYVPLPLLGVPPTHFFIAITLISFYALTVHTTGSFTARACTCSSHRRRTSCTTRGTAGT